MILTQIFLSEYNSLPYFYTYIGTNDSGIVGLVGVLLLVFTDRRG